jgi:molybdopterin/thiamine biosynthesis adenylyltransferase
MMDSVHTRWWSYDEAFARNRGLISRDEQQKLRARRVAIIGMGGVGGVHLEVLLRLGVGRFTIADPDTFDVANTNRQYGAKCSTMGRPKAEVMAQAAADINPEVELRVVKDMIGPENADEFLKDAELFIDGIDFYAISVRRMLFRKAAEKGVYAITAAPAGFGTAWLVFDPAGMSFDRYFDFSDAMDLADQVAAMAVGLAPKALQSEYMRLEDLNLQARTAPCAGLACHLACGVMAAEAVKILLRRGRIWAAPWYHQFDPYRGRYVRKRLWWGNRHPWQRLKRKLLARYFRKMTGP